MVEPKRCVVDPFECDVSEYATYLEADLILKNVNVLEFAPIFKPGTKGDPGTDSIELRLAFNQHSKAAVNVYDIYKFTYQWTKANINLKQGWRCDDGYSTEEVSSNHP